MTSLKFVAAAAFQCLTGSILILACSDATAPADSGAFTSGAGSSGAGSSGVLAGANSGGAGSAGSAGASSGSGGTAAAAGSGLAGSSGSGAGGMSGAANDAGAGGNAVAGTGGSAGAPVDDCGANNFCDSFEAYTEGGGFGDWEQAGTDGTLSLDDTHVYSGAQAVHFNVDAGSYKHLELKRNLTPELTNKFWGRLMVWASELPVMSDAENKNVHFDIVHAAGDNPAEGYFLAGMPEARLIYQPHDCYTGTDKAIPEETWACWEWLFDGDNNVLEFYIDGELQARVEETGQGCVDGSGAVWEAPDFKELYIGWINYQSKGAVNELWLDDVAVGPERLGCPEPQAGTR